MIRDPRLCHAISQVQIKDSKYIGDFRETQRGLYQYLGTNRIREIVRSLQPPLTMIPRVKTLLVEAPTAGSQPGR